MQKLLSDHQITLATLEGYRKQIALLKESHDATTQILTDEKERVKQQWNEEIGDNAAQREKYFGILSKLLETFEKIEQKNKELESELAKYKFPPSAILQLFGLRPKLGGLTQPEPESGAATLIAASTHPASDSVESLPPE
ncbi:MAG: hypothetical protein FD138_2144 [Planctomycetota bacterium]|nr:MAG: hypothetical protein FD138_2144 [Planctomycetota bacterium]